jgi:RHS repeat-associated protein
VEGLAGEHGVEDVWNGNLTSDGATTYQWDGGGQLASLSSAATSASFSYDAFGRRATRTVNGQATQYRYDGGNLIREQTGDSTATLLSGLGFDENYARTDANGTSSYLTDALGSTTALADGSGTVRTTYTYDPFGAPAADGDSSDNAHQFTGRESEGTGLDYLRARYYSPTQARFISEDPLGLGGGDANLYAYAAGNPISLTDPTGTSFTDDLVNFDCSWGDSFTAGGTKAARKIISGEDGCDSETAAGNAGTALALASPSPASKSSTSPESDSKAPKKQPPRPEPQRRLPRRRTRSSWAIIRSTSRLLSEMVVGRSRCRSANGMPCRRNNSGQRTRSSLTGRLHGGVKFGSPPRRTVRATVRSMSESFSTWLRRAPGPTQAGRGWSRREADMEIPAEIVPAEVRALIDDLVGRGYGIDEERYDPDAFGNVLIALRRGETLIRAVRDRGQWFAEVSAAGWNDWFSPIIWRALLAGSLPTLEPAPFRTQAAALLSDLDRIEAAARDGDAEGLDRLRAWRSRRAEARRALPPNPASWTHGGAGRGPKAALPPPG